MKNFITTKQLMNEFLESLKGCQKYFIIEGTRGGGKSTTTTWLREQIPYSQLVRLSGTADKSPTGLEKVYKARLADLQFAETLIGCDLHLINDRCFLTENVYADYLGYKEYSFQEQTNELAKKLNSLPYKEIYLLNMYVKDLFVLEERLKRDKADFQNLKFSVEESLEQQIAYRKAIDNLIPLIPNVKVFHVDASGTIEDNQRKILNIFTGRTESIDV